MFGFKFLIRAYSVFAVRSGVTSKYIESTSKLLTISKLLSKIYTHLCSLHATTSASTLVAPIFILALR